MKRMFLLLLALTVCLGLPCGAPAEDLSYGDYSYTILADGSAEITAYRGSEAQLVIPETLGDVPVTSIGNGAFSRCETAVSVVIPDSVLYIGDSAFVESTAVESVSLPSSLRWLGGFAFQGCVKLKTVSLPDSLSRIGSNPFDRCDSLTDLTISEEHPFFTAIGNVLFDRKEARLITYPGGLRESSYTIPEWVTTIGLGAFSENTYLEEITLPEAILEIEENPFCGCLSLKDIRISSGHLLFGVRENALFNKQTCRLIAYLWGSGKTSYTVPDGTAEISQEAFYKHAELVSVRLPDSLRVIGDAAFDGCSALTSINLPKGILALGRYAFGECTSLTRIVLPRTLTSIGDAAFYLCENLRVMILPEGVVSIGSYAFAGCYRLTSVNIPESVRFIGEGAFLADSMLTISVVEGSYGEEWARENDIPLPEPDYIQGDQV